MAGDKSVKSSPVTEDRFHLIHKIRMMSRTETGKDRLTDVGSKLVAQRNDQYDRQQDQQRFAPVLFINQDQQDQKG